jgi:hypothetical protein
MLWQILCRTLSPRSPQDAPRRPITLCVLSVLGGKNSPLYGSKEKNQAGVRRFIGVFRHVCADYKYPLASLISECYFYHLLTGDNDIKSKL